jgi:cytoskeletal protein RodZ
MLRSPRVRIVGSLFTVLLVAMVSLTVYAMIPFRALQSRQAPPATAGAPAHTTAISNPTGRQPATAGPSFASGSIAPTAATKPAVSTASTAVTSHSRAGQNSAGQNSAGQNSAGQNRAGQNSSTQPAASAAAAGKSQQSSATAAIRELFPTVNAKP